VRINLGVWLARAVPMSAGLCVAGGIALLALRRLGAGERPFWTVFAVSAVLAGAVAWRLGRGSFFSLADALVHVDVAHRLGGRLMSASAGVGEWPPEPGAVNPRDGLFWRWSRILLPLAFGALLLVAAGWVPISATGSETAASAEPASWRQVQSLLETLKKEAVVEPGAVASWQEKLDALRRRPRESWYSQSSLEAGDSLRDALRDGLRGMEGHLDRANQALSGMSAREGGLRAEMADKLAGLMDAASSGLEMGTLPLNPELLGDARALDAKNLRRLTPEELAELKRQLAKGLKSVQLALGEGEGDPDAFALMSMAGAGSGGVDRGPGVAPMWLNPEKTELGTKTVRSVSNADMSHAALGDLVGVGIGAHRVDKGAYAGLVAAGAAGSLGTGGDAVWKAPLMPEDQKVLRRYFK